MNDDLSNSEEKLMTHIWNHPHIGLRELIEKYEDPKPAGTTVATWLKRMQKKGYVGYDIKNGVRLYFPLVAKEKYLKSRFSGFIHQLFGDSTTAFASFFARQTKMSESELRALRALIDQQIGDES